MDNRETRTFQRQEVRAEPDSRTIRGYAAVFGSESEDLGGFTEYIAPGAFDGVLNDDVRALVNHNDNLILGRTSSGTLRLSVDERGLAYEFDVPNTSYGNDLLESVRRGDITQSSFGFTVAEDAWDYEGKGMGKKKPKRTIKKVARLYDVSPVTYPAYPDTSVALRSLQTQQEEENTYLSTIVDMVENEQAHLTRAIFLKTKKITSNEN